MTPLDRRWKMLEALLHRRRNTVNSLALEFDVSRFTVMRDIRALSCTFPIYTNHGGDGGVYIQDGYQLGMIYLTDEQLALLVELCGILAGERLAILQGIIEIYKRPGTR